MLTAILAVGLIPGSALADELSTESAQDATITAQDGARKASVYVLMKATVTQNGTPTTTGKGIKPTFKFAYEENGLLVSRDARANYFETTRSKTALSYSNGRVVKVAERRYNKSDAPASPGCA